jgi:hypothetical protein
MLLVHPVVPLFMLNIVGVSLLFNCVNVFFFPVLYLSILGACGTG